jgi:hypothetical protein
MYEKECDPNGRGVPGRLIENLRLAHYRSLTPDKQPMQNILT